MRYDIWEDGKKTNKGLTADESAMVLGITSGDLVWAITEHGRADIDGKTAKAEGSRKPRPWSDWHFARMC